MIDAYRKNSIFRFLRNPWLVTILGGIVVAFFGFLFLDRKENVRPQFHSGSGDNVADDKIEKNFGLVFNAPISFYVNSQIPNSQIDNKFDKAAFNIWHFNINDLFDKGWNGVSSEGEYQKPLEGLEMRYNLFNLLLVLPNQQEVFLPEVLANKSYALGIFNDSKTKFYIFPQYTKTSDLKDNEICFMGTYDEKFEVLSLKPSEKFRLNRKGCYLQVSGKFDFMDYWKVN